MYSHEHDAKLAIFLSPCNLKILFLLQSPYLLTYINGIILQRGASIYNPLITTASRTRQAVLQKFPEGYNDPYDESVLPFLLSE